MQDICILLVLVVNVFPLAAAAEGWSRLFELCDGGYLLHSIWMTLYDYCPIVDIGQYE